MRVSIVVEDSTVTVDGQTVAGLDLSFIAESVHAVQWYGENGEVEHKDASGKIVLNEAIDDFTPYQAAVDLWQAKKDADAAENAAKLAAYRLSKQI